jgi:hypothetical protein
MASRMQPQSKSRSFSRVAQCAACRALMSKRRSAPRGASECEVTMRSGARRGLSLSRLDGVFRELKASGSSEVHCKYNCSSGRTAPSFRYVTAVVRTARTGPRARRELFRHSERGRDRCYEAQTIRRRADRLALCSWRAARRSMRSGGGGSSRTKPGCKQKWLPVSA